jgi:hypothetical protein
MSQADIEFEIEAYLTEQHDRLQGERFAQFRENCLEALKLIRAQHTDDDDQKAEWCNSGVIAMHWLLCHSLVFTKLGELLKRYRPYL